MVRDRVDWLADWTGLGLQITLFGNRHVSRHSYSAGCLTPTDSKEAIDEWSTRSANSVFFPYCEGRKIETAATAPYVRGFLLAYQYGTKSYIGCAPCVRTKILGEAGLSLLIGWFSITALIINPFLIVYNLLQTPFIRANYAKARKKLNEAGVPEDQSQVDVTQLGYSLAASMIVADGQVDEAEIKVALEFGPRIFPDFDAEVFRATLEKAQDLPSPQDIATLLREVLTADGKKAVFSYLWMIAKADGVVEESEKKLLAEMATNIGVDLSAMVENR